MLTAADIEAKAKEIAADVIGPDGKLSWTGVLKAVTTGMEFAESIGAALPAMEGKDKKALVLNLMDYLLEAGDLPGPDFIVRPVVKTIMPLVIDALCSAAAGEFNIQPK